MSDLTPKIIFNPEGNGTGDACIANISPAERKKRMRFGIMQMTISAAILAALLLLDVEKIWRLVLYLPLAAAFSGFFQARDKT